MDNKSEQSRDSRAEVRLSKLFDKIEAIETKVKFLLKKASVAIKTEGLEADEDTRSFLRSKIKKYQTKLDICEEKKKKYEKRCQQLQQTRRRNRSDNFSIKSSNLPPKGDKKHKHIRDTRRSRESENLDAKKMGLQHREIHNETQVQSGSQSRSEEGSQEISEEPDQTNDPDSDVFDSASGAKFGKGSKKYDLQPISYKHGAGKSEDEDLHFAEGSYARFGGAWQTTTDIDEDRMCQKMHRAAFKKFSLQNIGFVYTRYLTRRYYNTNLFQYIPVEHNNEKLTEVRLALPLGRYNHQPGEPREVRFKRMDPIHKCHMAYYTYRTPQQLVDRIVSEAWKQWYPKRFYMSFDYQLNDYMKNNLPPFKIPPNLPKEQTAFKRKHTYPIEMHMAHVFRPVAIPIPAGMKQKVQLTNRIAMRAFGETHFVNLEMLHIQIRYKWGNEPIWCSWNWREHMQRKRNGNLWLDAMCFKLGFSVWPQIKMIFYEEIMFDFFKHHPLVVKHPQRWYSGHRCQGFNVKFLDKLRSENQQFKSDYDKWGKIHSDWDIANKRRS